MTENDVVGLTQTVLWATFALAVAFGAIAQKTHFCTMGAVADIVNMGDWTRMRMWVLAIAVAVLGFNAMVGLGWIRADESIYAGPRLLWLSNAVGGLLFGIGMVLGSGCGGKTLVRVGSGNLKGLVTFLALGLAAYATMRGLTGSLRVATVDRVAVDLPVSQDLPALVAGATGWPITSVAWVVGGAVGLGLLAWVLRRPEGRDRDTLLGGIGIGLAVVGLWWVTGRLGHVAEDPRTLEEAFLGTASGRMESLTFVAPIAYTLDWLMHFSDASKVLTVAIVAAVGVIVGSAAWSLATRSFRWEGFRNAEDTANHLVGGALMGIGGVTAMGCTIGQGLSGVSTLSLGSFIAFAGIVAGGVLALRYQTWRIERQL